MCLEEELVSRYAPFAVCNFVCASQLAQKLTHLPAEVAADIEALDAVISIRAGRKPKEEGQGPPPLRRCAKKLTLRKGPKPNEKDPKGDKLLALPVDALVRVLETKPAEIAMGH
jgi:hypothetical protein